MCRLDEERADRLQAEHEAEQAARARQRAGEREQQRLHMVAMLDQQVQPEPANCPCCSVLMSQCTWQAEL